MQMDINDFGLQQEAFGFGDSYVQMARSNTEFLNLFGRESKEVKDLKEFYFKKIDALPPSDKAGRDALFLEFETKLTALNASQAELDEVKKAKRKSERGEKIAGGLTRGLDIFNRTTQVLGIGRTIQGENVPNAGQRGIVFGDEGLERERRGRTIKIATIVGGSVIILGLVAYLILRKRK
jgi:hypothetical protein